MANKKKPQYYEQKQKKKAELEAAERAAQEAALEQANAKNEDKSKKALGINVWGASIGGVGGGLIFYLIGWQFGYQDTAMIIGLVMGAGIGSNIKTVINWFKKKTGKEVEPEEAAEEK